MRGANDPLKYIEFKKFVQSNSLDCFALVETKLSIDRMVSMCSQLWPNWKFLSNATNDRARIVVVWNPFLVDFKLSLSLPQIVHGELYFRDRVVAISFIYGFNSSNQREGLWSSICSLSLGLTDTPWALLGDFNAIRFNNERRGALPLGLVI